MARLQDGQSGCPGQIGRVMKERLPGGKCWSTCSESKNGRFKVSACSRVDENGLLFAYTMHENLEYTSVLHA